MMKVEHRQIVIYSECDDSLLRDPEDEIRKRSGRLQEPDSDQNREIAFDSNDLVKLKRRYECEPTESYEVFFARAVRQEPAELMIEV